ncbi:hypothetical protein OAN24_03480 [Pseudodesulfovibrio sp.]|nr:hypothetical protein [Pseudodesulfovibrio sp.]
MEYTNRVLDRIKQTGKTRILLDSTDRRTHLSYSDLAVVAKHLVANYTHLKGLRAAALCTQKDIGIVNFLETILRNRFMNLRSFTDEKEALDWLVSS